MDAGFLSVVENGQFFMTKYTAELTQFFAVACRENTLPREARGMGSPRYTSDRRVQNLRVCKHLGKGSGTHRG